MFLIPSPGTPVGGALGLLQGEASGTFVNLLILVSGPRRGMIVRLWILSGIGRTRPWKNRRIILSEPDHVTHTFITPRAERDARDSCPFGRQGT